MKRMLAFRDEDLTPISATAIETNATDVRHFVIYERDESSNYRSILWKTRESGEGRSLVSCRHKDGSSIKNVVNLLLRSRTVP